MVVVSPAVWESDAVLPFTAAASNPSTATVTIGVVVSGEVGGGKAGVRGGLCP